MYISGCPEPFWLDPVSATLQVAYREPKGSHTHPLALHPTSIWWERLGRCTCEMAGVSTRTILSPCLPPVHRTSHKACRVASAVEQFPGLLWTAPPRLPALVSSVQAGTRYGRFQLVDNLQQIRLYVPSHRPKGLRSVHIPCKDQLVDVERVQRVVPSLCYTISRLVRAAVSPVKPTTLGPTATPSLGPRVLLHICLCSVLLSMQSTVLGSFLHPERGD